MNSGGTIFPEQQQQHVDHEPISQANANNISVPLLPNLQQHRSKSSPYSTIRWDELRKFRISLKWCTLDHSTCTGKFISYAVFTLFVVVIPIFSSLTVHFPAATDQDQDEDPDPISFNKLVHLPESALATLAFFTLSRFFRRYSLHQLLFLDGLQEDSRYVRRGYTRELDKAFRYLACILLPSFFVELAHKIIYFSTVVISIPYVTKGAGPVVNSLMFLVVLASWVYRTGIFLLVCVSFRLTCELQILRLEGFRELLDGYGNDPGVVMMFEEHMRIRKQLSVTSHRYRFFIIGCLVTITISQLGALLLVFESKTDKTFFNFGELVVCSAVQLSGFLLSLLGATRITHRAQGIVSVATRWHMLVTCASVNNDAATAAAPLNKQKGTLMENRVPPVVPNAGDAAAESDPTETFITFCSQDQSCFQTRQALVCYLQHNNGGITLYGFALDRGLLHTLFAFETSLVLWILSKVVVLS